MRVVPAREYLATREACFFNDTATAEIYTLSLHDALPISSARAPFRCPRRCCAPAPPRRTTCACSRRSPAGWTWRSEEHTSELQSRQYLVCRLLLEKNQHRHRGYPGVLHPGDGLAESRDGG